MKNIVGFDLPYMLDEENRVLLGSKVLSVSLTAGYPSVSLRREGKSKRVYMHRIIASLRIPNPNNNPMVNHINGIKTDNRVENLEWVTAKENIAHSFLHGLNKRPKGSQLSKSGYSDADIENMIRMYNSGVHYKKIQHHYPNLSASRVYCICKGYGWRHIHDKIKSPQV